MRGSKGGPGLGLALVLGLVVWACAPASPPPSVDGRDGARTHEPVTDGRDPGRDAQSGRIRADL